MKRSIAAAGPGLLCALLLLSGACGPEVQVEPPPPPEAAPDGGPALAETDGDAGAALEDPDAGDPDAGDAQPSDAGEPVDDAGTPPPVCPSKQPATAPFTGVNSDPGFLLVYVNNVENLELPTDQCPGDWQDLFFYMHEHESPDVFLVQQISGQAQLDTLVQYMTDHLPGVFAGIIAEPNPSQMNSPCGPPKDYQTNAIIYRTGRLTPVGSPHVWQSWAWVNGACRRNFQARTKNVMQKFHDKVADKDVTVASLHWSTFQGSGPDPACAAMNAEEIAHKVQKPGYGGDLMIFGGDTNEPDLNSSGGYRPWYRALNGELGGDLGFRDAIFRLCDRGSTGLKACLQDNWTCGGDKRIDFLFSRAGSGCLPLSSLEHTITFAEADAAAQQVSGSDVAANYSDHRSVRAAIHY